MGIIIGLRVELIYLATRSICGGNCSLSVCAGCCLRGMNSTSAVATVSMLSTVVLNSSDAHGLVVTRVAVVALVISSGVSTVHVGIVFVSCSRR